MEERTVIILQARPSPWPSKLRPSLLLAALVVAGAGLASPALAATKVSKTAPRHCGFCGRGQGMTAQDAEGLKFEQRKVWAPLGSRACALWTMFHAHGFHTLP